MARSDTPPKFELVGGNLALDFLNTVSYQFAAAPEERRDKLTSYAVLLAWAEQAGAVTPRQARVLRRRAAARADDAAAAVADARVVRDALFRIVHAHASGEPSASDDLATANRALGRASGHRRLVASGGGYTLDFDRESEALDAPLWPVVAAAAELLVGASRGRVRMCSASDEDCSWLFVDDTRNHSRRWCTMKDCGNRAKARRHYARTKLGDRAP